MFLFPFNCRYSQSLHRLTFLVAVSCKIELCFTFSNLHITTFIHKFVFMQVEVNIGFDQLLKIVKDLPSGQLRQLKAVIEKEEKREKSVDLETLLLSGPTATKKQLDTIAKNRKAINQWRTK